MSEFVLKVFGFKYSGWTSLRLTRSMEQLAPSMTVQLTDRWTDEMEPMPIEAGDPFTVEIDGEQVISGFVDVNGDEEDAGRHDLTFTGRARTGDLVDCAAKHGTGRWRNRTILQIAKDLCDPFGIEVSTKVDVGAALRPTFAIEQGETVFECISRAARMRALLPMTDSDGDLYFDRVATGEFPSERVSTVLEYGKNIKNRSHVNDWSDRFSTYTIKSQSSGGDQNFGKAAASVFQTAIDLGVNRYRPTIILSDNEANGAELAKRVAWERNVRAGRSKRVSYTVPGWSHSGGLWEPNRLVRVVDPRIQTDDDLLISTVAQVRDDQGELTSLELGIPEAFDIEPLPKPQKRKKNKSFWSFLEG